MVWFVKGYLAGTLDRELECVDYDLALKNYVDMSISGNYDNVFLLDNEGNTIKRAIL